jgi:hypothetical protein
LIGQDGELLHVESTPKIPGAQFVPRVPPVAFYSGKLVIQS